MEISRFTDSYAKPSAGRWNSLPCAALIDCIGPAVKHIVQRITRTFNSSFLLRSLPLPRASVAIPGRFSSSSLPPMFVRGRFTAVLYSSSAAGAHV